MSAWPETGPEPSWWRKQIEAMTPSEYADFVREVAEAMKGLGGRVTLTIAKKEATTDAT